MKKRSDKLIRHIIRCYRIYFFIILLFAIAVRLPLVFQHLQDCDDSAKCMTYAPGRRVAGHLYEHIARFFGELLHLNVFDQRAITLYLGRSVSLALSIVGLVVQHHLIRVIIPRRPIITLSITTLLAVSQMATIYAVNSGPYGNSMLFHALILLMLTHIKQHGTSIKSVTLMSMVIFAAVHSDLTTLFTLPAFLVTAFILEAQKTNRFLSLNYAILAANTFASVVILQFTFLQEVMHRGATNYSVGIGKQFSYHSPIDLLIRFPSNLAILMENHFSPVSSVEWRTISEARLYLTVLILPIFIYGFVYLARKHRYLAYYSAIFFITTIGLSIFEKIALFAPTRHTLGYSSILSLTLAASYAQLNEFWKDLADKLSLSVACICFVLFTVNLPAFFDERRSKLHFKDVETLAVENDAYCIVPCPHSDWLGVRPDSVWWDQTLPHEKATDNKVNIMFVGSRHGDIFNFTLIDKLVGYDLNETNVTESKMVIFHCNEGFEIGYERSIFVQRFPNSKSVLIIQVDREHAEEFLAMDDTTGAFTGYWDY